MVDPTAWSQVRLPQSNLVQSVLQGAQTGVLLSEGRREREKYATEKEKSEKLDMLRTALADAHKANDTTKVNSILSRIATVDPEAGEKARDFYVDLDRTQLVTAATNLLGAAGLPDNEMAQYNLLKQAYKSVDNLPPTHGVKQLLQSAMDAPFGSEKRANILAAGINMSKALDLYPGMKDGGGESGLARDRLGLDVLKFISEMENRQRDNDRLEERLKQDKKEFAITSERFSPTLAKLYNGSIQEHHAGMASYNKMLTLADSFDELEKNATTPATKNALTKEFNSMMDWDAPTKTGGFRTWLGRVFRKFMGWEQKDIDALYTEYTRLKNKMVSEDLKPPVSDKDIAIMSKGYPGENANAAYIASFLRGIAKSKAIEASYAKAKSDYIDEKNDIRGFSDYWTKNKNKYIADAFGISEEALTPPPGIDLSNWSIPLGGRESRQPAETGRQGSVIPSPAGGGQRTKAPTPTIDNLKRSITERIKLARDKAKEIDPRGARGILERLEYDSKTGAIGFKDDEGNFINLIGPTQQGE